jgi:hypothetical protein
MGPCLLLRPPPLLEPLGRADDGNSDDEQDDDEGEVCDGGRGIRECHAAAAAALARDRLLRAPRPGAAVMQLSWPARLLPPPFLAALAATIDACAAEE